MLEYMELENEGVFSGYISLTGKEFSGLDIASTFINTKEYAGIDAEEKGFIANLPQLLHGVSVSLLGWNVLVIPKRQYSPLSEESVGRSPGGNDIFIEVHGGGIIDSKPTLSYDPKIMGIIEEYMSYDLDDPGFIDPNKSYTIEDAAIFKPNLSFDLSGAVIIDNGNIKDLLEGKLPDGTIIPVYSLNEFKKGIANLPFNYAIVSDLDEVKNLKSGMIKKEELYDNDLFIMRAGGPQGVQDFIDTIPDDVIEYGNRHSFNEYKSDQPRSCLLLLNRGNFGITENGIYYLRFVSVSHEKLQKFLLSVENESLESRLFIP